MSQSDTVNRRVVLAARPRGAPAPQNFRLDESAVPAPGEGEVLLRTLYLSLDPLHAQPHERNRADLRTVGAVGRAHRGRNGQPRRPSKDSHWLWVGLLAAGSLIAVFQGEPAGLIGDGLGREEAGLIW
jgi:hypothetical protein